HRLGVFDARVEGGGDRGGLFLPLLLQAREERVGVAGGGRGDGRGRGFVFAHAQRFGGDGGEQRFGLRALQRIGGDGVEAFDDGGELGLVVGGVTVAAHQHRIVALETVVLARRLLPATRQQQAH